MNYVDRVRAQDKAAALASYAKQAGDDEMMKTAVRIRDRAIRRAGELLKQIEPASTMQLLGPVADLVVAWNLAKPLACRSGRHRRASDRAVTLNDSRSLPRGPRNRCERTFRHVNYPDGRFRKVVVVLDLW
jgi:hypothetical protein